MNKNTIVIATGYQALFAYLLIPFGDPVLVKRIEFACDSQTVRWDERGICYIEMSEMITRILDRYRCGSWGLACRSEQIEHIRAGLPQKNRTILAAVMETDCEPINLCNVEARFMEASEGVPRSLAPQWA